MCGIFAASTVPETSLNTEPEPLPAPRGSDTVALIGLAVT